MILVYSRVPNCRRELEKHLKFLKVSVTILMKIWALIKCGPLVRKFPKNQNLASFPTRHSKIREF